MPAPEPTPARLRAALTTMHERPCWTPRSRSPRSPTPASRVLVVRGDWSGAPEEYRRLAGVPSMITAEVLAERLGGQLLTVPGFYPQVQQPAAVNAALARLWQRGDATGVHTARPA